MTTDYFGKYKEKLYFCQKNTLKERIQYGIKNKKSGRSNSCASRYLCQKMYLKIGFSMALEIRSIPVLTGEDAERFVHEAEENERNPQRRKLLFSFEDIDGMMERSRKYLKEHVGKGPFAK